MALSNRELTDASAMELAAAMANGTTTSVEIVTALTKRIAEIDAPGSDIELRSVLALAPDALAQAQRLDDERSQGAIRSPLHGVPILVKDNVEAVGLPGTAGSTALVGRVVHHDAPLITRLRDAGLVILGATNLSQWANMRSPFSTSGWSAVGGLTANPYRLDRCAGGSSAGSGAALAARLAPLAIGTETDGSITCPASLNGVAGIKPAVGTVPGEGIVPISSSQDSAGPMARTIRDVAALYEVLTGIEHVVERVERGLDGARVAVATNLTTGHPATDQLFLDVVTAARNSGVALSETAVLQSDATVDADELTVLLCEMFDDLTAFLIRRGGNGPSSLVQCIDFENEHRDVELPYFGHEFFDQSLATGGRQGEAYHEARARNVAWAVEQCLTPALNDCDRSVAPCYSPAWKNDLVLGGSGSAHWSQVTQAPAIAGWPIATVPMGTVDGLPVGLSLVGRPGSEATMLAVAAVFEGLLDLAHGDELVPKFIGPQAGEGDDDAAASARVCVTGFCYVERMSTELRGLRTIIYPTTTLESTKAWWHDYLGFAPYFDEPFYVGFDVAGYELGLVPTDETGASPTTYWGVDDVAEALAEAQANGAAVLEAPQDVGDGIVVASFENPAGHVVGLIFNPHFAAKS